MKKFLGAILSGILCAAVILGVLFFDIIGAFVKDIVRGEIVVENEDELYYYNHLGEEEKDAYRRIMDEIDEHPESIRIPKLTEEQLKSVFRAISYDQPQIACMGTNCRLVEKRHCYYFETTYVYGYDECAEHAQAVQSKIKEITANIKSEWNEYEKELYVHDYIAKNCTYISDGSVNSYRAYGALVEGKATCEGYARAAQMIFNELGMTNFLVVGNANDANGQLQGHMWNVVEIDGDFYHLDITWDDPVGQDSYSPSHIYFNLTSDEISVNHFDLEQYDFVCNNTKENYFVKNERTFYIYNEQTANLIKELFKTTIENGDNRVEFKFSNNQAYENAVRELFNNEKIYPLLRSMNEELETAKVELGVSKGLNEKYRVIMIIISYS